ncbi:hypothetical protein G6O69_18675 [Pseudenhygromyxa sp. WMMC2535]|uniref:hypothetical protein n=1 Tax=Pseudenhygromyxa sp. WMMC2535 TaxID=2712867 RepID=UPI00159631A3|nr:hypothetical protein [Pseudenhygromyxa sp. WMMC2535]NVB39875.1 hypothetical protein [Pseudenhygromyxa sp. WMMC2535]
MLSSSVLAACTPSRPAAGEAATTAEASTPEGMHPPEVVDEPQEVPRVHDVVELAVGKRQTCARELAVECSAGATRSATSSGRCSPGPPASLRLWITVLESRVSVSPLS